jgi:hypothetical protein
MGLALSAVVVGPAAAQSTIFNIPTTDTVAPKHGYFEFDYFPEIPGPDGGGRFVTYTPRIVFGVVNNVEAGVNISNTHVNDAGTFSLFQPDVKYKFYADDDKGLAAAAGIIGYIAINHRDASDSFGQIYANASKKIKSGARFTGGVWSSISLASGNTGGVLLGYEQPIAGSKVSFVADWFSGKNFWGYLTPGISVTLPHNGLLNIGYSIGNNSYNSDPPDNDTHNKALFVYYGITFP